MSSEVPAVRAQPHHTSPRFLVAMVPFEHNTYHGPREEECGCYCAPPAIGGSAVNRDRMLTAFRVGVVHLCVESLLCFITMGYVYLLPSIGMWLLFSFIFSIGGVSTAICCCPSRHGWRTNLSFTRGAYVMRFMVGLVCVVLAVRSSSGDVKLAVFIYLTIIVLSIPVGIPFLLLSKSVVFSLQIFPVGTDGTQGAELPTVVTGNIRRTLAPADFSTNYPRADASASVPAQVHQPVVYIDSQHVSTRIQVESRSAGGDIEEGDEGQGDTIPIARGVAVGPASTSPIYPKPPGSHTSARLGMS